MNTSATQPNASTSYAHGGQYKGEIVNIIDPENRNRVQVRIKSYQDDTGNIPDDLLEWIHCTQLNSQLPGATSTQPYYVGAQVIISDTGSERYVVGAVPGMDGDKRKNNQQADNSDNENPDTTNIQRSAKNDKWKNTSIRASPGMQPDAKTGANIALNFQNYIKNPLDFFKYAVKGKAPWGEGAAAKLDTHKSIGNLKIKGVEDVLDVIKNLDGNISGSIKSSIDIIKNLRMGGWGTGSETIGMGNIGAADAQFNGNFGAVALGINILALLLALIRAIIIIRGLSDISRVGGPEQVIRFMAYMDNVQTALTTISDPVFEVNVATLNIIAHEIENCRALTFNQLTPNSSLIEYETERLQSLFSPAFLQCIAALLNHIASMNSMSTSNYDVIVSLGGTEAFIEIARGLEQIASFTGLPIATVRLLCNGLIGAALNGTLANAVGAIPPNPNKNNQASQSSMSANPMIGNMIGMAEAISGQINKHALMNKKPTKYKKKDSNGKQEGPRSAPSENTPTPMPPPDPRSDNESAGLEMNPITLTPAEIAVAPFNVGF